MDRGVKQHGKRTSLPFRKHVRKHTLLFALFLGELNSPTKKKISRRTAARRLNEAGARTLKAVKDQLTSKHKAARVEWANIRIGDLLNDPDFFKFVLFSDVYIDDSLHFFDPSKKLPARP